jgi:hypothetical protein
MDNDIARTTVVIARSDSDDAIQQLAQTWKASLSLAMTIPR